MNNNQKEYKVPKEIENDLNAVAEVPREKKKKSGLLLKRIPIVVGMIIFQSIAAYAILTQMDWNKKLTSKDMSHENSSATAPSSIIEESLLSHDGEKEEIDDVEAGMFNMDDIVINPAGSSFQSFFVVSMVFLTKEKNGAEEFEKREPAIKDKIISLLCRKTASWLGEVDNREILRREIKMIVNRQLVDTNVTKVYFTKYVIQ